MLRCNYNPIVWSFTFSEQAFTSVLTSPNLTLYCRPTMTRSKSHPAFARAAYRCWQSHVSANRSVVAPLPEFVSATNPARFDPVHVGEFLSHRFDSIWPRKAA